MTARDEGDTPQAAVARILDGVRAEITGPFRFALSALYGLFGFECAVTGWAYLPWTRGPAELPAALQFSESGFPIWWWGLSWVVAGILGMAAAAAGLPRILLGTSIAAMAGLHLVWAAFYAITFFNGSDHRAFVTSAAYLRPLLLLALVGMLLVKLRPRVVRGE